jgi:hypothetical protein
MAILRIDRFKIDPADTEQMVARRNAVVEAARNAFSGLVDTRLVKLDDHTWIDMWRWDSRAGAQKAIDNARSIPEAGAAFSLVKDLTAEFAEIVDERWPTRDPRGCRPGRRRTRATPGPPPRSAQPLRPTCSSSQPCSGAAARRNSATGRLAAAVCSHGSTGQCRQAISPLCRNSSMRGWSLG